ncbi:restriction endonuclease subunit S [Aeromonas caviae]|uniref:restriction endonuclease subunit S n=1 Tax=Aeromonas caviae TaxID=648 RepID=UPI002B4883A1|nr:restriction endonuclease subunit S [Aeromonas caviae]
MADQMMQHNADELAAKQTIPAGFKWTEIGIIPEDWIIERLGMYASFRTGPFGSALHKSDYVIDGIPIVNPMQIIDGGIIPTSSMSISTTAATKLSEFRLQTGDIVIGRRGEMGRCAVVGIEENGWLCGTGSMIIRIKSSCESRFIQRVLSSKEIIAAIESSSVGTTMINLNQSTLRELKIFIPSNKNEQLAIATVLSDTDALISGLEQLIAKKQAIKTATMQQLLTGRTRLPQFALRPDGTPKGYKSSEQGDIPEDWDLGGFGELFESNIQRQALRKDELVTFVGMQDISESGKLTSQNTHPLNQIKAGLTYFERGDVLVAKITPCFENGKGCHTDTLLTEIGYGSTEFHVLRANECADSKFIYYWTTKSSLRISLEAEMVGSAGHRRVPFSALQVYQIPCPNNKNEQTAIATIFSDMDSELTALEQKLAKARDVKQGMMQQLLTGRIRLPLPQEA